MQHLRAIPDDVAEMVAARIARTGKLVLDGSLARPVHLATVLMETGLSPSVPLSTEETIAAKVIVPGVETLPIFRKVIPLS